MPAADTKSPIAQEQLCSIVARIERLKYAWLVLIGRPDATTWPVVA